MLRSWKFENGLVDKIDKCLSILNLLDTENYNMSSYAAQIGKSIFKIPVGRFETELTLAKQKLETMKEEILDGYRKEGERKAAEAAAAVTELEEADDDEEEERSVTPTN